jgi:Putative polyhydroxyalkanoic acid system protein (PHA_gran_rgn)
MRVTVSHNRRKEDILRAVDRSFDDLFKGFGTVPIQIVNESRKWTGSRMDFSFDARMGFVSTPIKGFVDVTDKDVTVDADLGWLERLFPAKHTQAAIEGRLKGLLP